MTRLVVPRPELVRELAERVTRTPPVLLSGPPGSGKTTLLLEIASALAREGWRCVYLDLMGAASSPAEFVAVATAALPDDARPVAPVDAPAIRPTARADRGHEAEAVEAVFSAWASLGASSDRKVALLLDEPTEIRSLAYFDSLRAVAAAMGKALGARPRGTLLATSYPTLARKTWGFEEAPLAPLAADQLAPALSDAGIDCDPGALARASFGWPAYLGPLVSALEGGARLSAAWAREMAAGGQIERLCRHTYETLLLRSRGYGISKAVLAAVAREEGQNLKSLVTALGRTPGAVRDYLQWLIGVDALRAVDKRYFFVDGMVRWWVRLHARGVRASEAELQAAAATATSVAVPSVAVASATKAESRADSPRFESFMELD
jgi:DNA polymerase III delta prime subunit